MRAVVVEKQHGRSKSVKARRAYVCFLEREVYAFLSTFDKRGERVRGAMLRARIFFCLWEGRRRRRDGPAADGPQAARAGRGQSDTGGTTREGCAGKREDRCFSFSREKTSRYFLSLLDGDNSSRAQLSRP